MEFLRKILGMDLPQIDSNTYKADYFQQRNHMLIDVRTPAEYKSGHIGGAKNIPLNTLANKMKNIPKDKPVVIVCQTGSRSASATRQLMAAGYDNVTNLSGGTLRWRMSGNPVE